MTERTKSICPECHKIIEAEVYEKDGKALIKKTCKEHGDFEDVYWSDYWLYRWVKGFAQDGGGVENPNTEIKKGCPHDCGLCKAHKSHTLLGLIDVTNRCNLKCPICFANANAAGYVYEPTQEQIRQQMLNLRSERPRPCPAVQFAGGEPTIRDDLPELIRMAHEMGFVHVEIASNGIRFAEDKEFLGRVFDANLNTVYLQFDGVTPEPYIQARGLDLLPTKKKVIKNFRKLPSPLATNLVPTLVKGINDDQMGDILRFAIKNRDVVRGVNVQPVSFAGRIDQKTRLERRVTIPDFMRLMEEQTGGQIRREDFYPVPCVSPFTEFIEAVDNSYKPYFTANPHCGMATYIFIDGNRMIPITRFMNVQKIFMFLREAAREIKKGKIAQAKMAAKAVKVIRDSVDLKEAPSYLDVPKLLTNVLLKRDYESLKPFAYNAMLISSMHFQDPYNYDVRRVERCVIHYSTPDGRIIPFCAYNILQPQYREKIEKKFSIPLDEWNKTKGKEEKASVPLEGRNKKHRK